MNGPNSLENPIAEDYVRKRLKESEAAMKQEICEKKEEIRFMKEKREKLRKKHRRTSDIMTTLRSLVPEMLHRPESGEENRERELEETHRVLTASALEERQLLLNEYNQQSAQVSQLMSKSSEQTNGGSNCRKVEGADTSCYPDINHTPVHQQNSSLIQPTPEREENLEKYIRRNQVKSSSPRRAKQQLFSPEPAAGVDGIAASKLELAMLESERDQMMRECAEIKVNSILMEEGMEGLMSEVQREREKYASLLEERRLLEETQIRMREHSLSPGPPPLPGTDLHPQYRRYRSSSDMDIASLAENSGIVNHWDRNVLVQDPLVERDWQQVEFVPIRDYVPSPPAPHSKEPSVLTEMADNISQMWKFLQQQPPPTATTPIPQYTSYPPSTPGLPPVPLVYPSQHPVSYYPPPQTPATHPFPLYYNSLPPAPSPLPYYQTAPPPPAVPLSYPPAPFYPSPAPVYMYQSLPPPPVAPLYPANQWTQSMPYPPVPPAHQSLPPLLTPPPSQEARVSQTVSCTQTDLTFQENPLSSQHSLPAARDQLSRRELPRLPSHRQQQDMDCLLVAPSTERRSAPPTSGNTHTSMSPGLESPLFDQVRERIYSEVASLVSENETRPFYLLELLRAAQLLNTDYLRQSGLVSLKRVINNYLNPDEINAEAFSSIPPPPEQLVTDRQREEEGVYSPTQNFPLTRHYLNTNLSGSSENVEERSMSRVCQLSDAAGRYHSLSDNPLRVRATAEEVDEERSDISEITTSDLSGRAFEDVSPCEQQVRVLVTRLIPILKQHLDKSCEPRLLALIHQQTLLLLAELFPEEVVVRIGSVLDLELKDVLSRYRSQRLRDCGEELLVDVSDLFFSQVGYLTLSDSFQLSFESEGADGYERDGRAQARDDALASATQNTPHQSEDTMDRTFTLSDSGLYVQGHAYIESDPPHVLPSSPTLSPPRVNIINLTLSESRPMDEDATSEKSDEYSHSKTVDTISETASCTASDLSEINPVPHKVVISSVPYTLLPSSLPLRDDSSSNSDDLPPFANTCLSQGSFTILPPNSPHQELTCNHPSNKSTRSEFIAEVISLTSDQFNPTGSPSPILVPSND